MAALQGASNRLINAEDLTEQEVQLLHRPYETLSQIAKRDSSLTQSHSIEEPERRGRLPKKAGGDTSHQS